MHISNTQNIDFTTFVELLKKSKKEKNAKKDKPKKDKKKKAKKETKKDAGLSLKSVENAEKQLVAVSRSGEISVIDDHGRERERYKIPYGALVGKRDGDEVEAGDVVVNWDPHTHPIITEVAGKVKFSDFIDGVTVNETVDEITGLSSLTIIDPKLRAISAEYEQQQAEYAEELEQRLRWQDEGEATHG